MSGSGHACQCPERSKPIEERAWLVTMLMCNYALGGRYKPSRFSEVHCRRCQTRWRTRVKYVEKLPVWNGDLDQL